MKWYKIKEKSKVDLTKRRKAYIDVYSQEWMSSMVCVDICYLY